MTTRREFIKYSAMGAVAAMPLAGIANTLFAPEPGIQMPLKLYVFSKHLQFLDYNRLGEAVKEMGFDGVDLTVRAGGHVLPERVADDLPKVTQILNGFGLAPSMISTAVSSAENPDDILVLKTAGQLGYKVYRQDWYKYNLEQPVLTEFEKYKAQIKALAAANEKYGIQGSYHNHSGKYMGSALWDLNQALEGISPLHLGSQYDNCHAAIDGGLNWEVGFNLIRDHINSIVIKDFKWEKVNGVWKPVFVPVGEGMVDFKRFFSLLKKYQINVPISMHFEYPLGGAEKGNPSISIDKNIIFNALKKDLALVRKYYDEAVAE